MISVDQGETWNKIYLSFYSTWTDIIYAQNKFIAIANSGAYFAISSEDGFNWTTLTIPQKNKWQSITYGNDIFVAVSQDGNNKIMTSTNGTLWLTRNIPFDLPLKKVKFIPAYENQQGYFIALTEEDITKIVTEDKIYSKAFISYDGITWNSLNISEEKTWNTIVYANGRFVTLANNGSNRLSTTIDNNIWPTYDFSSLEIDSQSWVSSLFFGTYYMAISNNGTKKFIRSKNGTTWESFDTIGSNSWKKIAASTNNVAVIATDGTNRLKYSFNSGETWVGITTHDSKILEDIIYGGKWLLISSSATNGGRISYSNDLTNWTNINTRDTVYWKSVAYGNNTYVAVGEEDTEWKLSTITNTHSWNSVTYGVVTATGIGTFVTVSSDSAANEKVMTSSDGLTWTAHGATNSNWKSITYGLVSNVGTFVAVADSGTNKVMTSINGTAWTSATAAENNAWQSVAYGNGKFVAVANTGTNRVMTSTNGGNWTVSTGVPQKMWVNVTYGNGLFIAVAAETAASTQAIMTSVDGVTWSLKTSSIPGIWRSSTYGANIFIVVGANGVIIASINNGNTWTDISPSYPNQGDLPYLTSCTYQNGKFVVVSLSNKILTSEDAQTWVSLPGILSGWSSIAYGNNRMVATATVIPEQPTWTQRVMTDFIDNNKVIWSSDGGATWSNSSISVNKNWKRIKYLANNQNSGFFALSSDNKIYYSIDGKNNWIQINIPTDGFEITNFITANLFLIFLTNKNKIIITGTNITDANFSSSISVLNIIDNLSLGDIEVSNNGQIVIASKPNKIIASASNGQSWTIKNLNNLFINKIRFFKNNFFILSSSETNRVIYFQNINSNYNYITQNTLPYSFMDMLYLNTYYLFLINTGTQRIIKTNNFIEVPPEDLLLQFKNTIKDIYNTWIRIDNLNSNEIVKNRCLIVNQKINYNKLDNGFYRLEICANDKFYLYHVFMTNDKDCRYAIFVGNQEYTTKEEAKNNIFSEINKLSGLPFNDFLPLGSIIYEVNSQYQNSSKARIVNINGNNYFKLIKKDLVNTNNVSINKKENIANVTNNSDLINLYGNKILEYALNKLQNLTSRDIDNFITRKEITLSINGGIDNIINIFGAQITGSYEIFDKNNPDTNMFFFLKQTEGLEPEVNITSFSNLIIPSSEKGQTEALLGIYIDSNKNIVLKNFSDTYINLVIYRKL